MEMFLTILFMSLFALAACAAALGAATRGQAPAERRPERRLAVEPPRFFAANVARPATTPRVPVELILSQIERHVRLEQAAAEAFLDMPTPDSLRSPTASPFLN